MEEIDIKDFLNYLKKYLIPTAFLLAGAVAGTYFFDTQLKTPVYQSSTSVVLVQANERNGSSVTLSDIDINRKLTDTYSEIAKSKSVLQRVVDDLELSASAEQLAANVSVTPIENTTILRISVKDTDAELAAKIANKIAAIFTEKITTIYKLENVSVLDSAKTPTAPSNNTLVRDMAIAALLSVFGVFALAFLIFYFDDTVKYSEDLEQRINIPIVGKVVKSDVRRHAGDTELLVKKYPKSIVSESIKSLRTNLQFTSVDKGLQTILITSSLAGEGKSFVSSNLAVSFAQAGRKVLIIDCDLRKGRLHKIFNVLNVHGLSDLLADDIKNSGSYIKDTKIEGLSIITRGSYPPNPSELLSSKKNKDLIKKLKRSFDIIIFDGAPCNGITDSVIISTLVDTTMIVTRDSSTPRATLAAAKESLDKVDATVAGVVLNAVDKKVARYYSYYGDQK